MTATGMLKMFAGLLLDLRSILDVYIAEAREAENLN
jgi:hypothetical protein